MEYIPRNIDRQLKEWKDSRRHKPLLLRGARQVGKSSSIRHLGSTFDNFVEINFEQRPEIKRIFEENLVAKVIVSKLTSIVDSPIIPGKTLLFFDEIQECPAAITSLRYFWEEIPDLHVIAAGSLLEFALNEISTFGVGRIRSMFMYPLSFDEFLRAQGSGLLADSLSHASPANPPDPVQSDKLVDTFRTYIMVGGMPEAVATWIDTRSYIECRRIHNDIISTYEIDFAKYSSKISPTLLRLTLRSVVNQIGCKFVYSRVGGDYRAQNVREALSLLSLAGIIVPVTASSANGLPLEAEERSGYTKYLYLDSGLLLAIQNMMLDNIEQTSMDILTDSAADLVNKGPLTEMIAGNEIIRNRPADMPPMLYYWLRENKNSTAEVDYIISYRGKILPIEIKAGVKGGMKSLRIFLESKGLKRGIRMSLEPFGTFVADGATIDIIPLYAVKNLFIKSHS